MITSLQNQRVKDAIKLRKRRARKKQGRTIVDGSREIWTAIQSGAQLVQLFVCNELIDSQDSRQVVTAAGQCDSLLSAVSRSVYEKLAYGDRTDGVIAVIVPPKRQLSSLLPESMPTPLVAVLEGIEKPGNIGAIIRTADGAGVSALVVVESGTDLYNPNAIRASLGTIFTLPVCTATRDETIQWLTRRGIRLLTACLDGDTQFNQADFTGPTAIVLGSEAYGLSDSWQNCETTTIRLPMQGTADSLNVSAAAAVLFYEALRQRRVK